jgi:hypothetical protein
MIRTTSTRIAVLESRYWLQALQARIEQAFLAAARDVALPEGLRTSILTALRMYHQRYALPPVGWERDPAAAYAVADAHTKQARAILGMAISDFTLLRAVCDGMHDRLLAEAYDDAPTL